MADVKQQVKDLEKSIDFTKTKYQVNLDTSFGPIHVELFPDVAPGHSKNLIALSKAGFYDGLTFHRIVKGFVIQGGCPNGSGTGGPGYTVNAEFNNRPHEPGVLSMARTNDPNSAGSQFFICLERVPYLDGQYTVFGRVADKESLEVVKKIGEVRTGPQDRPLDPVFITKAVVVESPL
jgi:peptidyl-prolyl cis-trans isomerase B (cyclophilin B)